VSYSIPLVSGGEALIDPADAIIVGSYTWRMESSGKTLYAVCYPDPSNYTSRVWMHRLIIGAKRGEIVDHVDGNGLNNVRGNLRICTHSQNARNKDKTRGRSRFKGVSWNNERNKWKAKITVSGRDKFLGYFDDEVEAACKYDSAAKEYFEGFERPNHPPR
jgi:hypothetical protein